MNMIMFGMDSMLPFSCFLTIFISFYHFLEWLSPQKHLIRWIIDLHQAIVVRQKLEIQTIKLAQLQEKEVVQPEVFEMPQEVENDVITPKLVQSRKLTTIMKSDLYLDEMRKKNKKAMRHTWKRSFYFPLKGYLLTKDEDNLNVNYLKLTEKFKRPKIKKRNQFLPTILPAILEYEIY